MAQRDGRLSDACAAYCFCPRRQNRVADNDMVELFDIMATMLELGGTKATHTNFARSLVPQLNGNTGNKRSAAFAQGGFNLTEPQAFDEIEPGFYNPKTCLEHEHP